MINRHPHAILGARRASILAKILTLLAILATSIATAEDGTERSRPTEEITLDWKRLPDLPDELGVAGPLVGIHNNALIVAGGANFARPVWEHDKVWHDTIYVLTKNGEAYRWTEGGTLARRIAYAAAVSTADGVVCMGGNDGHQTLAEVFVLTWDPAREKITRVEYPPLPRPCAYAQAALVGHTIYLAGGQSGEDLDSAQKNFWALDLSQKRDSTAFVWQELEAWPGVSRAFNLTVHQHNGQEDCIYVIGGRRQEGDEVQFLEDVWEFTSRTRQWRRRSDAPRPVVAGMGIGFGPGQVYVLGGDDGSLFFKTNELKDEHPGFPKEALVYHTITDTWVSAGPIPRNHVTTIPVLWDGRMIIASGEIRPRVRSASIWSVAPIGQ